MYATICRNIYRLRYFDKNIQYDIQQASHHDDEIKNIPVVPKIFLKRKTKK